MKHIFEPVGGVIVPDGTKVYEIFGPNRLKESKLSIDDAQSLALGEIPPHSQSHVHVHPIVTHLTYVLEGRLTVKMKDMASSGMYTLNVDAGNAVYTAPCTFFQLVNDSDVVCRLLYVVSPAFIFLTTPTGEIVYNDQLVPGFDWEELASMGWKLRELDDLGLIRRKRDEALIFLRK